MATTSARAEYWIDRLVHSRHGLALMFVLSFLEALILPIPLELVLIPYMLKARQRIWSIASMALLGFLAAATVGYYLGAGLFESVGPWVLESAEYQDEFERYRREFERNGFWAIVIFATTPLQFQVAMLVAGVMGYPLALFWLASALSRGALYYGLGLLVLWFGDQTLALWRRLSKPVAVIILVLVVAVYLLLRWI